MYIFGRKVGSGLYSLLFNRYDSWNNCSRAPALLQANHMQYFRGQVLFSTVVQRRKLFTSKKFESASKASHFMARMGAGNSAAAKRMIKNIDKCPIAEREFNVADQISGPRAVESLHGYTKNTKSHAGAME